MRPLNSSEEDLRTVMASASKKIVSGSVPKYLQLLFLLRNQILTGELRPGEQLPAEEPLCKTYGLSRGTVRQAMAQLEAEGLILTQQGTGSFVTAVHPNATTFDFSDSVLPPTEDVSRVTYKVVAQELITIPGEIAERLHLPIGSKVIHIARQRVIDGKVLAFSERYMPEEMLPSLLHRDLTNVARLPGLINSETEFPLLRFEIDLEAHLATKDEALLLDGEVGSPIVLLHRMTYSAPNRPAVWYRGLFKNSYWMGVWIPRYASVSDHREQVQQGP